MPLEAIILAAGLSSRVSGFKPLKPLGGRSAVERLIRLFREAGAERVLVVTGRRADELEPVARAAGAEAVFNPEYESEMFSSVRAAVAALGPETEAFFVHPVDVMLLRLDTVKRLLAAREAARGKVLHPAFRGRRGHPPLIPAEIGPEILEWGGEGGLAGFLAEHEDMAVDVPVADEQMLFDVDTDEDYREAQNRLEIHDVPSRRECLALLDVTPGINDMGRRHSEAVADFALQMAQALNRVRGDDGRLDSRLVEAAALLHDIAKGLPDHEREGGRMLEEMGYPRVAGIVAAHRDIDLPGEAPVGECEIVFLADKLARGDGLVSVEHRFRAKMEEHAGDPEAVAAIRGRMERALKVKSRLEEELGERVEDLVVKTGE